jgi:hypothetical protein
LEINVSQDNAEIPKVKVITEGVTGSFTTVDGRYYAVKLAIGAGGKVCEPYTGAGGEASGLSGGAGYKGKVAAGASVSGGWTPVNEEVTWVLAGAGGRGADGSYRLHGHTMRQMDIKARLRLALGKFY